MITSPRMGFLSAYYVRTAANGIALTNAESFHEFVRSDDRTVITNRPPLGSQEPRHLPPNGFLKAISWKFNTIAGGAASVTWHIGHCPAGTPGISENKLIHTVTTGIEIDATDATLGNVFYDLENWPFSMEEWYEFASATNHNTFYLSARLDAGTALARVNLYYGVW